METSQSTCSANQWTGFYMIEVTVMKELSNLQNFFFVFSAPFKTLITITQSEPIQTSTMELFEKCLTPESCLTFDVR